MTDANGRANGIGYREALPPAVTHAELRVAVKALADAGRDREERLLAESRRQAEFLVAKEQRTTTIMPVSHADTSLIELALNSLVMKAVDQVKLLEAGQLALPTLVQELVAGLAAALGSLQLTVNPQVSAPAVTVTPQLVMPPVENIVEVPSVTVDLSELAGLLRAQYAALERNTRTLAAVVGELKGLRTRTVRRRVVRNGEPLEGDIVETVEEIV